MAVTSDSTPADIKEYQRQLNAAGANLTVDGIWGPLTQAASDEFGDTVEASPAAEGERVITPGNELWNVDGNWHMVRMVPGTEADPIYMAWTIPDDETLESYFPPGVDPVADREATAQEMADLGVETYGTVFELIDYNYDPFTAWLDQYETQAKTQPWILDADYKEKAAMAAMEGRALTDSEIEQTMWFSEHTDGEKEWMKLSHSNPVEAQRRIDDNRARARNELEDAGVNNAPEDLVWWMADQVTTGLWSLQYYSDQLLAISDPASSVNIDPDFAAQIADYDLDTTRDEEQTVRDELTKWLGPNFGGWNEDAIGDWAGKVRNDPDALIALQDTLSAQRVALFPEYEDRTLTYDDIAGPWRTFWRQAWGESPDETDGLFSTVVRNNDAVENGKILTQEGMNRGIDKVNLDVANAMRTGFRSSL